MKKSLLIILVAALFCMQCVPAVYAAPAVPEISGGQLMITEPGTYRFVGSMKGTVLVDPGEGDVVLILDNFRVDGDRSAGIVALSGDSLTIRTEDRTSNHINDGGSDPEFNAAIFSRVNTFFEGYGSLNITGFNKEAIHVENADLIFSSGDINLTAPDRAITVEGSHPGILYFDDGTFNIQGMNGSFSPETNAVFNGGRIIETDPASNTSFDIDFNNLHEAIVKKADSQPEMLIQPGQTNSFFEEQFGSIKPAFGQQNGPSSLQPAFDRQDKQPSMSGGQEQNNGIQQPGQMNTYESAASASEIVSGTVYNSAMDLTADYENAVTYDVSETSQVKISESGT